MKCIVIESLSNYHVLQNMVNFCPVKFDVDLTAYFQTPDNAKIITWRYHHDINQTTDEKIFEEVEEIIFNKDEFEKFYIVGEDFTLRQQLFDMGIDYKKISMCYGDIINCQCPLDEIFVIPKKPPEVPFKKVPVEIYKKYTGETSRAHNRRLREGFFKKYCNGEGLDIGYGGDVIVPDCAGWDLRNGDAQYLAGIDDESFDFVYSSHCLEHMYDVRIALKNWFRVVRKGGYLLLAIPHRDLYEKKKTLPSRWNADHKHMFLIGKSEPPDTLDIVEEIKLSLNNYDIKYIKACDEGHTITDPLKHSNGEYQIEIVIQKI